MSNSKKSNRPDIIANSKPFLQQLNSDFNALVKKRLQINILQGLFDLVRKKSKMLRQNNSKADGLAFWKPIKETLARYSDIVASGFKQIDPRLTSSIMELPEKVINGYGEEHMIELHHFMIQAVRIPIKEKPTLQKILQIALNLGQYEGLVEQPDPRLIILDLIDYLTIGDIVEINKKLTDEIMEDIVRISVLQ
jgi:hypothetical protein